MDSTQEELKRALSLSMSENDARKNAQKPSAQESTAKNALDTQSTFGAQESPESTAQDMQKSPNALESTAPESCAPALCIVANRQTKGKGTRGNVWENQECALMFSFSYLPPLRLPSDVPMQSMAIFLGFVIKERLAARGSKVWLKYPNDLYINDKKIGGILIEVWRGVLLCGVGINLKSSAFGELDILLDKNAFLVDLFDSLQNPPSWKQIFRKYEIEFCNNFPFAFHFGDEVISLKDAVLLEDGGLSVKGRVIYNTRNYRE